jgi:hypothetical protein
VGRIAVSSHDLVPYLLAQFKTKVHSHEWGISLLVFFTRIALCCFSLLPQFKTKVHMPESLVPQAEAIHRERPLAVAMACSTSRGLCVWTRHSHTS